MGKATLYRRAGGHAGALRGVRRRGAAAARLRKACSLRVLAPFRRGTAPAWHDRTRDCGAEAPVPSFYPHTTPQGVSCRRPQAYDSNRGGRQPTAQLARSRRVMGSDGRGRRAVDGLRSCCCGCARRAVRGRRRDPGIRAGAGLPEQSDAERAARGLARHRRGRAAGGGRVSSTHHRHLGRRGPAFRGEHAGRRHPHHDQHPYQPARRQRRAGADDLQRSAYRQPDASGRVRGARGPRDVAQRGADRAARCGDRLHERAARYRDPRSAAPQRAGAAGTAQADARPLQCRRGDAHRRRPVGIARGGRAVAGAVRGSEPEGFAGGVSPCHRRGAGRPARRDAGGPAIAAVA